MTSTSKHSISPPKPFWYRLLWRKLQLTVWPMGNRTAKYGYPNMIKSIKRGVKVYNLMTVPLQAIWYSLSEHDSSEEWKRHFHHVEPLPGGLVSQNFVPSFVLCPVNHPVQPLSDLQNFRFGTVGLFRTHGKLMKYGFWCSAPTEIFQGSLISNPNWFTSAIVQIQ